VYTQKDFNLNSSHDRFWFFHWLYNFPSALSLDDKTLNVKTRLNGLKNEVNAKRFDGFTTQPTKRPKTEKKAPPGEVHTRHLDNPSTSQMLFKAGYQLLPEIQVEGWTPFHPVRSSSIQVYTAPLNCTMTATVDRLPCKGINQQRRESCRQSHLQVCRAGRVRHTFIPPRMQVIGEPHYSYPRKFHMPM